MTKETVKELIANANARIDKYVGEQLPKELGYETLDEMPMSEWFKAQELIKAQKFYETNHELLKVFRAAGFDVKMDMQSDKLVFYGEL